MKVAICDDEVVFLNKMEELLKSNNDIESIEKYNDIGKLYRNLLSGEVYDVIFMDIEWNLPNSNGTHFAAKMNERNPEIQIIYVTAYNDRFSQAIFWEPTNLCGYLVKPVKEDNLTVLLDKAKRNIARIKKDKLVIQYKGVTETLHRNHIIYVESKAHTLFIHTLTEKITVYDKLDEYEKKLRDSFVRIHKSYLVNMDYVKRIESLEVTLKTEEILPASKSRVQEAKNKYFKYMSEQL